MACQSTLLEHDYAPTSNILVALKRYLLVQLYCFFYICWNNRKYDIVYVNTLLPFGAACAAFVTRRKVIYHIHESYLTPKIVMKSLLFIANMTASKVIFVSEYLKKLNFGNTKSSVIYNTSEVAVVHRAKLDHDAEKFVVLMICSMKVYKGVMEFISLRKLMERDESIMFELVLNASDREVSAFFGDTNIPLNMNVFSKTLDTSIFLRTSEHCFKSDAFRHVY